MDSFPANAVNPAIRFIIGQCPLGFVLVAMSGRGISFIGMGDDANTLSCGLLDKFPQAQWDGEDSGLVHSLAQVIEKIEKPNLESDLPLDIQGTLFQQRVWLALREIPVGTTVSYSQLAGHIGSPKAVRAVAGACAANKLAVMIPCHRVVGKDGSLSGYRWGIGRKAELLRREKINPGQA
ncbi:MAG: methylated-DNA--[protein]-cysteine S-methyltransferase [Methylovulum sp.]|uniref:methylated-DNA--[protein]-cysteine S-methyltransferase n=1 Tax=Methylovulum sp. TaxID=1916980 RepID=UPI002622897B|nr:methylated-DNA--[protein]-cysteine S-methyltransferase [Methylovulum sp.]MDD2724784.1 methylated-DNA--[protein]-cysteine S-methyltransferase [Methylovulum sp.]MDD5124604.1 methylated-DNA--[protein]-cysteine S-methyltransferase [Methylovulum sp.]